MRPGSIESFTCNTLKWKVIKPSAHSKSNPNLNHKHNPNCNLVTIPIINPNLRLLIFSQIDLGDLDFKYTIF